MKPLFILITIALAGCVELAHARESRPTDCTKIDFEADFAHAMKCNKEAKPGLMEKQKALLAERYDLSNRPATDSTMFKGKRIQEGVRVRLPEGMTWARLNELKPAEIKEQNVFPMGFRPLVHPNHAEGGMLFPQQHIDELLKQTDRDLTRFDLDFDIPDHFMPEFPAPMFLNTRPDLGDVSQGELVTSHNFYRLFKDIVPPKQVDGLRLLVTPFAQQQFNLTNDRRSERASLGVTCFDCHANGHTNGGTHLNEDTRPQAFRHRIETPSLRGVNVQRLFGLQRALKTIEDFTEFEQSAAYFDGDMTKAIKKGMNKLDRLTQVQNMGEFQQMLDFPPAPKLDIYGKLNPNRASEAEMRGQTLFFGKAQCAQCHTPPFYTDNGMHDLKLERFFKDYTLAGKTTKPDKEVKTFPLRGIKESPPYFHDGRLLTLDDVVEFFNLVLQTKLQDQEKQDLVAFLKAL